MKKISPPYPPDVESIAHTCMYRDNLVIYRYEQFMIVIWKQYFRPMYKVHVNIRETWHCLYASHQFVNGAKIEKIARNSFTMCIDLYRKMAAERTLSMLKI